MKKLSYILIASTCVNAGCASGREFWTYVVRPPVEKTVERESGTAIGEVQSPHVIRVNYSDGSTSTQGFAIELSPVNDNAPTLSTSNGQDPTGVVVQEDTQSVLTLSAADADGASSTLTFGIANMGDGSFFSLDPLTG